MGNHPIPQDVTGFQFKLIGNMTIKQFLYLAIGSALAWILYLTPLFTVLKIPLVLLFFLTGFSLAFIPIEGRPMDSMLLFFIKALFSENQFMYQKMEAQSQHNNISPAPQLISQTTPLKNPVVKVVKNEAQEEEKNQKEKNEDENQRKQALEKEALLINEELQKVKIQETKSLGNTFEKEQAHKKASELQTLLNETLAQKESLEKQLFALQQQLTSQKQRVFTPAAKEDTPLDESRTQTQNVKTISKTQGKSAGLPITPEVANVITGIVKDPRGNILPNILIEVKDNDGTPSRAFKTNVLGQFASATPLSNGVYTVEFEDPEQKHAFDAIEIEAKGEIILPLEVTSIDDREKLRKELFNTT